MTIDPRCLKRTILRLAALACCALVAAAADLAAESPEPSVTGSSYMDWNAASLYLEAEVDVSAMDKPVPAVRATAEEIVLNALSGMLRNALFPVPHDSYYLIGDRALENSAILTGIERLGRAPTRVYGYLSDGLEEYRARFQFDLFPDVISLFTTHGQAYSPEPLLLFEPTTAFSGILIYAKGLIPVHGETTSAVLAPGMFPRIFDDTMGLVLEAEMVDPEYLATWGLVRYGESSDIADYRERIGEVPLTTVARKVFGVHRTDIVISTEAAGRILATEENRRLLREGRVVVICDL